MISKQLTLSFLCLILAQLALPPALTADIVQEAANTIDDGGPAFALPGLQDKHRKVTKISFYTPLNLNYDDLISSVPLRVGMELTDEALRQSESGLMLRKVFSEVTAMVRSHADGLELRFFLQPEIFLERVEFSGDKSLDDRQLQRLAAVRYDLPLSASVLSAIEARLQQGYADQGYRHAAISISKETLSANPNLAVLRIRINEGNKSLISKINFSGTLPPELASKLDQFQADWINKTASKDNLRKVRRELLLLLRREGYLQASVELITPKEDSLSGNLELTLNIIPHEPVNIVFSGNTLFSSAELLAPLKLHQRTTSFGPGAIRNLRSEVRKFYQEHGYSFTTVHPQHLGEQEGRKTFLITISESPQYRLNKIEFRGNFSFSARQLRALMKTAPSAFWLLQRWQPGFVVDEKLEQDVKSIKEFYDNQGFPETKIARELNADLEHETLTLVIYIKEGPRHVVRSTAIHWKESPGTTSAEDITKVPAELQAVAPQTAIGSPLSPDAVSSERKALQNKIRDLGYPNAIVETEEDYQQGQLDFYAIPGQKIVFGKIVPQGNSYTHDYVIERELAFSTGEVWSNSAIAKSQEDLAALRFFRSVSIAPLDGTLDEAVEDIAVSVLEQDSSSLELRGSLNTEDGLHLGAEAAQRNLFGSGASLISGLDGYVKSGGDTLEGINGRLALLLPRIMGSKLDLTLEGFAQSSIQLIKQYSYDRAGLAANFHYRLAEHVKGNFGWTGYNERLFDVEPDVIIGPNDQGTTYYSALQTGLDYDRRDSPYNPRSGHRSQLDLRFADVALGSQAEYAAATGQESVYLPLGTYWVWANNARLRSAAPFGQSEVVPLSSRYFLGGRDSLRGFSPNTIGPRGYDQDVVGGDTSFNFSTELQYNVSDKLQTVVFLDLGQAILNYQGNYKGNPLNFSDMRYSPGTGLRYQTPIGPVSLDIGFATNRHYGERWGRVNIGIGNTF